MASALSMRVVFVGTDSAIVELVTASAYLGQPDATVMVATTATAGINLLQRESPDLVVLYPDFPDMALSQAVQTLRRFSNVPIIVLGHAEDRTELIASVMAGADDFAFLPCGPAELMLRMSVRLSRSSPRPAPQPEGPYRIGDLEVIPITSEVFLRDRRLQLTPTEFRLLHLLASNHGNVVTHRRIFQALWRDEPHKSAVAKKYIERLRRKLGDNARNPRWIATVTGIGYRFIHQA